MKISVVISLAFLLILQSVGTQVLFHVQRGRIRQEIKMRIKNGVAQQELISFKIAKNKALNTDCYWLNEHEFRFNNQMFDVVKQSDLGADSLLLQCVSDHQENELFANLNVRLQTEWNAPDNQKNKKTVQLAFAYEYLSSKELRLRQSRFDSSLSFFDYKNNLEDGVLSPPFTPPKTILHLLLA